jgi:hypothetical protein
VWVEAAAKQSGETVCYSAKNWGRTYLLTCVFY